MRISFSATIAALSLIAATQPTLAALPVNGLPSCLYVPGEPPVAGKPPIYISVDAQGQFYSYTGSIITLGGGSSYSYSITPELQMICDDGFKIALFGADGFPARPAPYVVINEFVNRLAKLTPNYVLTAKEAETSFIQRGGAGTGWSLTPYQLRIPRVADELVPVHRFLGTDDPDADTITHFFTADEAEYAIWQSKVTPVGISSGWKYEGIAFWAPKARSTANGATCGASGQAPVYRVAVRPANKRQSKYRFVANTSVIVSMTAFGATVESASFCALSDN